MQKKMDSRFIFFLKWTIIKIHVVRFFLDAAVDHEGKI